MSTTIKYTNEFANEVSLQQMNSLSEYFKVYLENEKPSKKEYYVGGVLQNTVYTVNSKAEITSALSAHPNASFEYSYGRSIYNITELHGYNNGQLNSKAINVFNQSGGIICHKYYELSNNIFSLQKTEKFYFDEHDEEKYEFVYNQGGTCFRIYDLQDGQADIYAWSIGVDPTISFTWNGLEYYQNAEPLIPS